MGFELLTITVVEILVVNRPTKAIYILRYQMFWLTFDSDKLETNGQRHRFSRPQNIGKNANEI